LILQPVELLAAGLRINQADLFALLQEDAGHANVRLDGDGVEIDQIALTDGPLVLVAVDHVVEICFRMRRRRSGQAGFDGVKVVKGVPPEGQLGRGVAAMAFVGDDQVEGVDRDRQLVSVVFRFFVTQGNSGLASEESDGHTLNRADANKGVAWFRPFKILPRHLLGVKLGVLSQVFPLEPLTVNLVNPVKF
jgi:hypothetical protein